MVENNNLTGSAIESITALRYLYVGFGGRAELVLRTWQALFPMNQCNYYNMHASLFDACTHHAHCACLVYKVHSKVATPPFTAWRTQIWGKIPQVPHTSVHGNTENPTQRKSQWTE